MPLRFVLQVLFFEQLQLRTAISNCLQVLEGDNEPIVTANDTVEQILQRDGWVSLVQQNRYLRVDMERMRSRVRELEKEFLGIKQGMVKTCRSHSLVTAHMKSKRLGCVPLLSQVDPPTGIIKNIGCSPRKSVEGSRISATSKHVWIISLFIDTKQSPFTFIHSCCHYMPVAVEKAELKFLSELDGEGALLVGGDLSVWITLLYDWVIHLCSRNVLVSIERMQEIFRSYAQFFFYLRKDALCCTGISLWLVMAGRNSRLYMMSKMEKYGGSSLVNAASSLHCTCTRILKFIYVVSLLTVVSFFLGMLVNNMYWKLHNGQKM